MANNDNENVARWKKLGKLGFRNALRVCGASDEKIDVLTKQLTSERSVNLNEIAEDLDVVDGRCVLLAVLGHGTDQGIHSLTLIRDKPHDDISSQVHSGFGKCVVSVNNLRENEVLALCVNLASNRDLRHLSFYQVKGIGTPTGCRRLARALAKNAVLESLEMWDIGMGVDAAGKLMAGLEKNESLQSLHLRYDQLEAGGMQCLAQMLTKNRNLKALHLLGAVCDTEGAKHLSSALKQNISLEEFAFSVAATGRSGIMEDLLDPFVQCGLPGAQNTGIRTLIIEGWIPVPTVASMIRNNKTLSELRLQGANLWIIDWKDEIIPALKANHDLRTLDLRRCDGLAVADSSGVLKEFMNLVRFSNTGLENIRLGETDLWLHEGQINEELRKNKDYRRKLRNQASEPPTSGRLVLCGYEFAGKTSICETIRKLDKGIAPTQRRNIAWKKYLQKHRHIRQCLFGRNSHMEMKDRTRGIDIVVVGEEPYTTAIWDFAGQREYYVLHDYLFPNSGNSCFVYVCSARSPPTADGRRRIQDRESMKKAFEYWMRFIASNTKPVQDEPGQRRLPPEVIFVLTNKDTLNVNELTQCTRHAESIVNEYKHRFQGVLSLSEKVEVVDALSEEDVGNLFTNVKIRLEEILQQSSEYKVCGEVRRALTSWSAKHPSNPFLTLNDFEAICREKVRQNISADIYSRAELDTKEGRETVLAYLNDVGDVIFGRGLNFVVVNPRWFGVGLLGSLINAFGRSREGQPEAQKWSGPSGCCSAANLPEEAWTPDHDNGFVTREDMNDLLRKSLRSLSMQQIIGSSDLIDLMIHLEMCFEVPGDGQTKLFIPALFEDARDRGRDAAKGMRKLTWTLSYGEHYVGRRLECSNKMITCLTPGFFPRLQVVLRNFVYEQKWAPNPGFRVDQNLISFWVNGMEVLVEYSGDVDYFVDILVKSCASREVTLQFVRNKVVKKIVEFCASPQGCQGVQLVEAVIRPICVKQLFLCADRKHHAVLASDLLEALQNGEQSYRHMWREHIDIRGVSDHEFDYALDLLEGEGAYRSRVPTLTESRDLVRREGSYRYLLDREQLPKFFYPTMEGVGRIHRWEAKINLGNILPMKMHIMCEGLEDRDWQPHEVQGQTGRLIKIRENASGPDLPLMKWVIRAIWATMKVSASTVQVSLEIKPIEDWVNNLFSTPEMTIDMEKLVGMMNCTSVHSGPVSHQEIMELLKEYLNIDPCSEWLKGFLNLGAADAFHREFKLRKVMYLQNYRIAWLCDNHFQEGFRERIVRSVPH